jgi:DNA-directed RNA polymerase subunit RPC12/RpoP
MKVTTKIDCQCGSKNTVKFKRPGFMNPVTGSFTCDTCGSRLQYFISRAPGEAKSTGKIHIRTRYLEMSHDLMTMIAEEQKAKTPSEENTINQG